MDIVARPTFPPGQCIASLMSEDPKGFVDTGLTPSLTDDARIIVAVSWIEECAHKLGWKGPDEVAELEKELMLREDSLLELEDELSRADAALDAIDVIESRDFRTRKKAGRPKKPAHDDLEAA